MRHPDLIGIIGGLGQLLLIIGGLIGFPGEEVAME
jgi:hypothetical protein